jgi:hypothetical protein
MTGWAPYRCSMAPARACSNESPTKEFCNSRMMGRPARKHPTRVVTGLSGGATAWVGCSATASTQTHLRPPRPQSPVVHRRTPSPPAHPAACVRGGPCSQSRRAFLCVQASGTTSAGSHLHAADTQHAHSTSSTRTSQATETPLAGECHQCRPWPQPPSRCCRR